MAKTPKHKAKVKGKKVPIIPDIKKKEKSFLWSFSNLDCAGPFGWDKCKCHNKYLEILKRFKNFEGMNINDLKKTYSHNIKVEKLSSEAQRRLRKIRLDDIDELYSLRITARERVFCRLINNIFTILWWDPDHQVCLSKKKNT